MSLRLAFAVATHADADVLIVDEALAVGDGYFQKKSIDRITDFHRRGGTLLFCSHALYYVALLCDEAIWLKNGEVAAQGPALPVVRAYEAFLQEKERALAGDELAAPFGRGAAARTGASPARLTEVFVHDGSGYPRTEFAAGETLAVEIEFETEDPSLAFHVRVGVDREDGVQAFAMDTRREPWAPADGPAPPPDAPRRARSFRSRRAISASTSISATRRRSTSTTSGSSSRAFRSPRPDTSSGSSRRATSGCFRSPRRGGKRARDAASPPRLEPRPRVSRNRHGRDYGARLARLRWRRAAEARTETAWEPDRPAADALGGAGNLARGRRSGRPSGRSRAPPGAVRRARPRPGAGRARAGVRGPHAPRARGGLAGCRRRAGASPGLRASVRAAGLSAGGWSETIELYIGRLLRRNRRPRSNPGFRVVALPRPSERERPELDATAPGEAPADPGCRLRGGAGTIAAAVPRHPGWRVTGIERGLPPRRSRPGVLRPRPRRRPRRDVLPELARTGERFDAVVFADVLEHLEDPVGALAAGRAVADRARRLLVSVPNVGHLSIVRDLVAGRFDPIPAGLTDARHLRWFTRAFLAETIEEAGWRLVSIESERGAPPPDPSGFLARTAAWPGRDDESLATYQWVALGIHADREPVNR